MKKYKIACLGEMMWDVYTDHKNIGGVPANFAVHIAQAGHKAYLFSRIGSDNLGNELVSALAKRHVQTQFVQTDSIHPTGSLTVKLDPLGNPSFSCTQDVAFDYLQTDKRWLALANKMDAVFFTVLAQRSDDSRQVIQAFLQATNAVKICDVNIRRWNDAIDKRIQASFQQADILKFNQQELQLVKNGLQQNGHDHKFLDFLIRNFSLKAVVVTLADQGSLVATEDQLISHPGFETNVVDATGSGDAFTAMMTIQYLHGASWLSVLSKANKLGALVAGRHGAVPEWRMQDVEV